jgi:hypothetical protein
MSFLIFIALKINSFCPNASNISQNASKKFNKNKKLSAFWHRIIIYLRELTFSATLVWQKTLPSVRLAMV